MLSRAVCDEGSLQSVGEYMDPSRQENAAQDDKACSASLKDHWIWITFAGALALISVTRSITFRANS